MQTSMDGWTVLHYLAQFNCEPPTWRMMEIVDLIGELVVRAAGLIGADLIGAAHGADRIAGRIAECCPPCWWC